MTRPPGRAACWITCSAAGATLVLGFAPFDLWPLAAVAPAALCWVAVYPGLGRGTVLVSALLFGAAFFLGTIYWVAPVMSRHGDIGLASAGGILLLLVAYLTAFLLVFALSLRRLAARLGPRAALAAAPAIWVALELARNHLLSGFPWVRLGTSLHAALPLLQVVSVAGVYGASALLMVPAAALAAALQPGGEGRRRGLLGLGGAAALFLLCAGWGGWRIDRLPAGDGAPLRVALVQGNVPQDLKWEREEASRILDRHLALSREAIASGADLVVWPESSMPFSFRGNRAFSGPVRALARESGVPLVIGTTDRREGQGVFNSAFLIDARGEVQGVYDKSHLVPFGEYVPLRRLLSFAGSLVAEVGEMSPGSGAVTMGGEGEVPALGAMICYEVIFPELARASVREGARLLVNLTNDAWFGRTSAPSQHFAEAVVRAVETGRWLVRAANTGISGIVDPAGRVTEVSSLEEAVVVSGVVAARTDLTLYVRAGDSFAWACAILGIAALFLPARPPGLRSRPGIARRP